MSNAFNNATKLQNIVSVTDFGAVGDGVTDDTAAITAWLAALSLGTVYGEARRRKGYAPAGVYLDMRARTITANGIQIEGDGDLNTIFLCGATSGDAWTIVGNQFDISNLAIYATTARQAGTGRGIYINAGLSTTSARGTLRNVHILQQPGDGLEAVRVEQHHFERVWVSYCGGRGIYLNHGAGQASWNTFVNCRAQFCDGIGIELSSNCINNTLTHPEALNFGGTTGIKIAGRNNILINPDAENVANVTGATTYIGISLTGSRHQIQGGYIGDVNRPILLTAATDCAVVDPLITNGGVGVTAAIGVEEDSSSRRNRLFLPGSATNVTAILSPAVGQPGSTVSIAGTIVSSSNGGRITQVAGGATYGPDALYANVFEITLDQNITITIPTNTVATGGELKFIFIQNGTGGYTVTWNGAYKVSWSNTGNTANKRSSVSFIYSGSNVWTQDGAQAPYV